VAARALRGPGGEQPVGHRGRLASQVLGVVIERKQSPLHGVSAACAQQGQIPAELKHQRVLQDLRRENFQVRDQPDALHLSTEAA
jgi:hypothetical protein